MKVEESEMQYCNEGGDDHLVSGSYIAVKQNPKYSYFSHKNPCATYPSALCLHEAGVGSRQDSRGVEWNAGLVAHPALDHKQRSRASLPHKHVVINVQFSELRAVIIPHAQLKAVPVMRPCKQHGQAKYPECSISAGCRTN